MTQVFVNLIENSISFSPKKSKILIELQKIDKDKISIKIFDQGKGIHLNDSEKIFERFYTDRKDDRKSHSGLGLSISKSIIESFGGTINLKKNSHEDFEGACFEIKLPLKES